MDPSVHDADLHRPGVEVPHGRARPRPRPDPLLPQGEEREEDQLAQVVLECVRTHSAAKCRVSLFCATGPRLLADHTPLTRKCAPRCGHPTRPHLHLQAMEDVGFSTYL